MGPIRAEKERNKRKINVILTPNPSKVLKKLRAEDCAVHVFVPGESEDLRDLKSDTNSGSLTVINRAGLKRLKKLQSELQSPEPSSSSSEFQSPKSSRSSSNSSSKSETTSDTEDKMSSG